MSGYTFDCGFGLTRYGFMIWPSADECVGGSFKKYGEYSKVEVGFLCKVVQPGMTVVDVGANIGATAVPMGKVLAESGLLVAFEPQLVLNKILTANLVMNECYTSQVIRALAGNKPGQVKVPVYDYSKNNNYGAIGIESWKGMEQGNVTPIVPIDSLGLEECHFMKIDAEGMEQQVLEGAVGTIEKFHPLMFVENDREEGGRELIRYIKELGYRPLWFRSMLFSEDNFFGDKENIYNTQASFNMVCIPPEGSMSAITINGLSEANEDDVLGSCVLSSMVSGI